MWKWWTLALCDDVAVFVDWVEVLSECAIMIGGVSTDSVEGLSEQTRWFVQARTNLHVLLDSFAHAPSRDMSPELLRYLIRIMQVSDLELLALLVGGGMPS
ncbi:unnamed protein product [Hydatigera taeniaeformis]|uniref:Nuclear pore complex protein Nup85 n=1 Tax=Hydatigena taeniaeformis TaxID=6205 RepID=A0A0R3WK77_HYDTA|nr:unnamed protein product [Hydatigera taeniaeformis]